MVILSQTKMWSSAPRKKIVYLLTDKSVVICSQTKMWSSADRQKCGHLLTDKKVVMWTLVTIGSTKLKHNQMEACEGVEGVMEAPP